MRLRLVFLLVVLSFLIVGAHFTAAQANYYCALRVNKINIWQSFQNSDYECETQINKQFPDCASVINYINEYKDSYEILPDTTKAFNVQLVLNTQVFGENVCYPPEPTTQAVNFEGSGFVKIFLSNKSVSTVPDARFLSFSVDEPNYSIYVSTTYGLNAAEGVFDLFSIEKAGYLDIASNRLNSLYVSSFVNGMNWNVVKDGSLRLILPLDIKKDGKFVDFMGLSVLLKEHVEGGIPRQVVAKFADNFIFIDLANLSVASGNISLSHYTIHGVVMDQDGNLVNTTIVFEVNGVRSFHEVVDGSLRFKVYAEPGASYNVLHNNMVIHSGVLSGIQGMPPGYYISMDLPSLIISSSVGFKDADRDGVPDGLDSCPNSLSSNVDVNGCDCSQKNCSQQGCVITELGPECGPTCFDGFLNGNEQDVDCGGSCPSCPSVECDSFDSCLSPPEYCDSNGEITTNCSVCGCPYGFSCSTDNKCYSTVNLQGLRCKTEEFEYSFYPVSCSETFGEKYVKEPIDKYVHIKVKGWLPKFVKKKIKKKIIRGLRDVTLCIKAEDYGCVAQTLCPGEVWINENKKSVEKQVVREAEKLINDEIPSFLKWLGTKAKVIVSLDNFEMRVPVSYSCAPQMVKSSDSCLPVLINGPFEKKLDLLFVGDEYLSVEQLRDDVLKLIDYNGSFAGTDEEGLFSIEPFKSNKEKFNIWVINGGFDINHSNKLSSDGSRPEMSSVLRAASMCPFYDHLIVLSKSYYRSYCSPETPCFIALDPFRGRLLIHEYGHGFGHLADEYHDFVIPENVGGIMIMNAYTGVNCKETVEEARKDWKGKGVSNIGDFRGCGGDCDDTCLNFVRPTYNSVMRNEVVKCNGRNCDLGPPFDPYFAVNEQEITKRFLIWS